MTSTKVLYFFLSSNVYILSKCKDEGGWERMSDSGTSHAQSERPTQRRAGCVGQSASVINVSSKNRSALWMRYCSVGLPVVHDQPEKIVDRCSRKIIRI